jgi:hypothetical protein
MPMGEMRASFTETMGSIPEYEQSLEENQGHSVLEDDGCFMIIYPEAEFAAPSKLKTCPWGQSCSDFKAAVSAGLGAECGVELCDDTLGYSCDGASRSTIPNSGASFAGKPANRLPDGPISCDGSWSATEDADPPGQALRLDPPQACRSPSSKKPSPLRPGASVRITLHNAPADKGLAAVASVEHPEDGSPCRLRICRGAATLALFVLDGKSISISLVSAPSFRTTHPGIPRNASGWIKVSCEGGGDMYACAALGWRALMPFLYQSGGSPGLGKS